MTPAEVHDEIAQLNMEQTGRLPPDLFALADAVSRWIDEAPGVPAIYVFGSRVRGDHRPDSDVDLCLFQTEWDGSDACTAWWDYTSGLEYRDLADLLPGPPRLHLETWDAALRWVDEARADPSRIVLQVRKAVCLWTPPKRTRKP